MQSGQKILVAKKNMAPFAKSESDVSGPGRERIYS